LDAYLKRQARNIEISIILNPAKSVITIFNTWLYYAKF
jgi:hypothetical protein